MSVFVFCAALCTFPSGLGSLSACGIMWRSSPPCRRRGGDSVAEFVGLPLRLPFGWHCAGVGPRPGCACLSPPGFRRGLRFSPPAGGVTRSFARAYICAVLVDVISRRVAGSGLAVGLAEVAVALALLVLAVCRLSVHFAMCFWRQRPRCPGVRLLLRGRPRRHALLPSGPPFPPQWEEVSTHGGRAFLLCSSTETLKVAAAFAFGLPRGGICLSAW